MADISFNIAWKELNITQIGQVNQLFRRKHHLKREFALPQTPCCLIRHRNAEKRDSRAELLFSQSKHTPIAFFPFSLTPPSRCLSSPGGAWTAPAWLRSISKNCPSSPPSTPPPVLRAKAIIARAPCKIGCKKEKQLQGNAKHRKPDFLPSNGEESSNSLYFKVSLTGTAFRRVLELKLRRFWATHVDWKWEKKNGSEAFALFICLDANKFVLQNFFSLIKTIYPRVSTKPLANDAKSPLPVDVRCYRCLFAVDCAQSFFCSKIFERVR